MTLRLDTKSAQQIRKLRSSLGPTIVEMARDIDEDPATFFEGGDWSGLDLRPCDLTKISFAGANLDGVCLFEDQLDLIQKTKPASLKGHIVFKRVRNVPSSVPQPLEAASEIQEPSAMYVPHGTDCDGFNDFISKSETYVEPQQDLAEMDARGIAPDAETFRRLISNAESYEGAHQVPAEMDARGIAPDSENFKRLISKAESYEGAQQVLAEMEVRGIALDAQAFKQPISKVPSYNAVRVLLAESDKRSTNLDAVTFRQLISKAMTDETVRHLLTAMENRGYTLDAKNLRAVTLGDVEVAPQIDEP